MEGQSWVCTDCRQKVAKTFCQCKKEETFLCEDCVHRHFAKAPGYHSSLPIEAFGEHRVSGYADRLQSRIRSVDLAKDELLHNLSLFDECIKQLTAAVEGQVNTLKIWLAGKTADLRIQKATIEREMMDAISEVMGSMYVDAPDLERPFAVAMRNFKPGENLREVCRYTITPEALVGNMDEVLKLEVNTGKSAFIPCVDFSAVSLFNCAEKRWEKSIELQPRLLTSADTQCILIDKKRVFACGGMGGSRKAYIIKTSDGSWETVSDMRDARSSPGLVYYTKLALNCVYAFGGYSEVRTCERLSLKDQSWSGDLPAMEHSRSYFSPLISGSDIYLVGGCCNTIEVYMPDKNGMKALAVKLPEAESCITFLNGNNMCVFSVNYFTVYTVRQDGDLALTEDPQWLAKPIDTYLKSGIAVDNVGFMSKDGFAAWFDLQTGRKLGRVSF